MWAESTKEPDKFDLWERDQSTISQIAIGDEFDSFVDGNPVLLGERETSLSWWFEEVRRRTYPNLSWFAIDILSMPAMSAELGKIAAEPERVFSGCRRTITWQRMRLGVKVVEEGECLKSWIRSDVVAGLNSKVLRIWRLAMAS